MEIREVPISRIAPEVQIDKLNRSKDYELAVRQAYSTLPREQAILEKKRLWAEYEAWATNAGILEVVTPQMKLAEITGRIAILTEEVAKLTTEKTNLEDTLSQETRK
jgi:uncharacterized small protein (DUF1192 family)